MRRLYVVPAALSLALMSWWFAITVPTAEQVERINEIHSEQSFR